MQKIPVILDTDIGTDIDDTWTLAQLLRSPELDLKLVTIATGNTALRARLAARLLDIAGRTDVPIGIGVAKPDEDRPQARWVRDYPLDRYPGKVHTDGVEALVRAVMDAPEPITLITIAPLTNIAEALRREPRLAERCRLVAMLGSVDAHHEGAPGAIAEWNITEDIPACQAVWAAPWRERIITPLDTCGQVRLAGAPTRAALRWRDLPGFHADLVRRLTGGAAV